MDPTDLRDWLAPLHNMGLRRTRLAVTLRRDVAFDDPACSIVRGLAAASLRGARCLTRADRCEGCVETAACDYASLVGTGDEDDGDVTRPWWPAGVPGETSRPRGDRWQVTLTSVPSRAPRVSPLVAGMVDALERLGDPMLTRNAVEELDAGPVAWPAPPDGVRALRVTTVSPILVRLDGDGGLDRSASRCPDAPWLAFLAGAALRRVSALVSTFAGERTPRIALPDLGSVRTREGALTDWRGSRFSRRQRRRIPLRGFAGSAVVEGDALAALYPLLEAATVTSVGRSVALGFGSLRVEALR